MHRGRVFFCIVVDELHHVMVAGVAGEGLLYRLRRSHIGMVTDMAHAIQFHPIYPDVTGRDGIAPIIENGKGRVQLAGRAEFLFYPGVMDAGRWLVADVDAADATASGMEIKHADKPV